MNFSEMKRWVSHSGRALIFAPPILLDYYFDFYGDFSNNFSTNVCHYIFLNTWDFYQSYWIVFLWINFSFIS